MSRIKTCLWYDGRALEAAEFYVSLFADGEIHDVQRYGDAGPGPAGSVMTVVFTVGGHDLIGLNGGPQFTFGEAISLSVECDGQAETDRLWNALTADGGEESQCGWLKDKYGLSWQIVPTELTTLLAESDPETATRVTRALYGMKRIDIAALRAAAEG